MGTATSILGFILEAIVVGIIVILQFRFFSTNSKKRKELKSIFPLEPENHLTAAKDFDGITQIDIKDFDNKILREDIVEPINSYLDKNKGATDYHIIKELTDRSCDTVQEEVDSYNPVPLYLGLCGTMLGIIAGIFFLWLGGGLGALLGEAPDVTGLAPEKAKEILEASRAAATQGIQHLLGGVAMAMIASLVGVILTIIGTKQTKNAVSENEEGRNKFLSWIQCNLLPKMSSDVVSTLGNFYTNLNEFNSTFANNSRELKSAFEAIKRAYQGQTEYTKELNKLDVVKAQAAFAALGNATDKINDLNRFLQDSSQYLAQVVALSDKLDTADSRTKAIESMGEFFKNEIEQINVRKALLSESVGKIDLNLKESLSGLQTTTSEEVSKLQEHLSKIYVDFQNAVKEQQELLEKKLGESSLYLEQFKRLETIEGQLAKLSVLDEILKNGGEQYSRLGEIENLIKGLEKSISADALNGIAKNGTDQLDYLKRIESAINRLSSSMPTEVVRSSGSHGFVEQRPQDVKVKVNLPVPSWLAYVTCGVLIAAGLFSIVFPLLMKFLS